MDDMEDAVMEAAITNEMPEDAFLKCVSSDLLCH